MIRAEMRGRSKRREAEILMETRAAELTIILLPDGGP